MSYYYDGVGVRVRKVPPRACRGDDPDWTTLYAGPVEQTIGPGLSTDKQFTGQTPLAEGYVGTLYDYVARACDPVLGRFIGAGTPARGHDRARDGERPGVQQIHARQ